MKKILPIILLITGTIIGAGFASGREISLFFARYGVYSLFFLPMLFCIFHFSFKMFLKIGQKRKFNGISELNSYAGNSWFMNVTIKAIFIVFSSAMMSAAVEILSSSFVSVPSMVFYVAVFLISYLVLKFGFGGLVKLNAVLVPVLILSLFFLSVFGTFNPVTNLAFQPESSKVYVLPISIIIYATGNLMLSYYLLVKAGNGLSDRQINRVSFFSALIICLVIFSCIVCLIVNGCAVMNSSMPFVALSLRLGEPVSVIFVFVVLLGVLTTLFSSLFTASEALGLKKHNETASLILVLALSLVGFQKIVDFTYPVIGFFGIVMIVKLARALAFKPRFQPSHNKVHPAGEKAKY